MTYTDKHGYEFLSNSNLFGGELILSNIGSIGKVFIVPQLNKPMTLAPNSIMIRFFDNNHISFVRRFFESNFGFKTLMSISSGTTMKKFNKTDLKEILIPIPPLQEQERIVTKIDELFVLVDKIEKDQQELEELKKKVKDKVLELAVTGKLVKQDPNDEPASVLLERIKAEKEKLIKEGKIKREKADLAPISDDDKNYYEKISELPLIPHTWKYTKLSFIIDVARGGSPRPIQDYLTTRTDGYNWIKIGDTNINSKYITSAKEKILKDGLNKTRLVHPGDFLLTNSMSFGHPYILKIDGCIHDGWLVLSDHFNMYNRDFLYYLLSSTYIYKSFCSSVGGSVVKNLNSDKVLNTIIPLLSKQEQARISSKIENIFKIIEVFS